MESGEDRTGRQAEVGVCWHGLAYLSLVHELPYIYDSDRVSSRLEARSAHAPTAHEWLNPPSHAFV